MYFLTSNNQKNLYYLWPICLSSRHLMCVTHSVFTLDNIPRCAKVVAESVKPKKLKKDEMLSLSSAFRCQIVKAIVDGIFITVCTRCVPVYMCVCVCVWAGQHRCNIHTVCLIAQIQHWHSVCVYVCVCVAVQVQCCMFTNYDFNHSACTYI